MATLLETKQLTKKFGGLTAVNKVDMVIEKGEIRGLIGPNGSGKTTFVNLVTGIYYPTEGEIYLEGKPIDKNARPHVLADLGIARTFQKSRLFGQMSILQNVMLGMHCRTKSGLLGALTCVPPVLEEEKRMESEARKWIDFVGFKGKPDILAGGLDHGGQRLIEIARALATQPKIIMLDEPVAGMNPTEKERMVGVARKIREEGITVFIIEHDMKVVMGLCDKISALNFGEKIAEGTPDEIKSNKKVIEAYLGEEATINA